MGEACAEKLLSLFPPVYPLQFHHLPASPLQFHRNFHNVSMILYYCLHDKFSIRLYYQISLYYSPRSHNGVRSMIILVTASEPCV